MESRIASLLWLSLSLLILQGCSGATTPAASSPDAPAAQAAVVATSAPAAEPAPKQACTLVSAQDMSTILGKAVTAEPDERSNGKTECIYKPVKGLSPYVEFSVEWGGGEAAMTAMRMMGQVEPGTGSPYQGLGDQAASVGPELMIRTGEDLVTLVFSGVDNVPAKAKMIFDTAKARM